MRESIDAQALSPATGGAVRVRRAADGGGCGAVRCGVARSRVCAPAASCGTSHGLRAVSQGWLEQSESKTERCRSVGPMVLGKEFVREEEGAPCGDVFSGSAAHGFLNTTALPRYF